MSMNNIHRVIESKPDLPVIEFSPLVHRETEKPDPVNKSIQKQAEQEDIFEWLSSH